jgi:hypothetical protein
MIYLATVILVVLASICIAVILFPERRRDRKPRFYQDTLTRTGKRKYYNVE